FNELFHALANDIYRLAYGMLGHREDAEDATQEAFIRIYLSAKKYNGRGSAMRWIWRVCRNVIIDFMRQRQQEVLLPPNEIAIAMDEAEWGAFNSEPTWIVREALHRLKPADKEVLVMHYCVGKSVTDIAQCLGISESGAKMRLLRARERFRALVQQIQNKTGGMDEEP
ncbi:MAG TPA: RNA polymerase sigma factor, partial [Armatimonadetes bacterium]|nr:RNA polymerase sigma factor [Armatimonadota bacterium]